jgi:integrase
MHTFQDCFEILKTIQSAKAKNTYDQCVSILKHLQWFQDNYPSLTQFETEYETIWAAYISHNRKIAENANKKPRMLGHDRRIIIQALKRANIRGWITKKFSKQDFALLQFSEPIGKHIPDEFVQKILNFLHEHSERTYLQVLMAFTMGLRISEILQLRKEEVNLELREINFDPKRLKTRRPRKTPVPITSAVYALLKQYYEASQGIYIFPSMKNHKIDWIKPQSDNSYWWTKARQHAGYQCRFHDLRHSCLSNALARGMPPLTASKIFGCTQEVLNRVYDHIRVQDRELHRAILEGISHDDIAKIKTAA